MTQEEQDAVVGRTIRSFKEAKELLARLDARNQEIAIVAKKLASALEHSPESIHISMKPEGAMATANSSFVYRPEDAKSISPEFLQKHLEEYRRTKVEVEKLQDMVTKLGVLGRSI